MKKKQSKRALGYHQASVVDHAFLKDVAGGQSASSNLWTTKITLYRTGGDVGVDGSW
jgi:hypothetical protein